MCPAQNKENDTEMSQTVGKKLGKEAKSQEKGKKAIGGVCIQGREKLGQIEPRRLVEAGHRTVLCPSFF